MENSKLLSRWLCRKRACVSILKCSSLSPCPFSPFFNPATGTMKIIIWWLCEKTPRYSWIYFCLCPYVKVGFNMSSFYSQSLKKLQNGEGLGYVVAFHSLWCNQLGSRQWSHLLIPQDTSLGMKDPAIFTCMKLKWVCITTKVKDHLAQWQQFSAEEGMERLLMIFQLYNDVKWATYSVKILLWFSLFLAMIQSNNVSGCWAAVGTAPSWPGYQRQQWIHVWPFSI